MHTRPKRRVFYWENELKRSEAEWDAIKQAYQSTDMRVSEICTTYDLSPATLYARACHQKWEKRTHRKKRLNADGFRQRLATILDLKLSEIEQDLAGAKTADLTAIANLLKLFDKADDTAGETKKTATPSPKELTALRQRILDRIDTLRCDAK